MTATDVTVTFTREQAQSIQVAAVYDLLDQLDAARDMLERHGETGKPVDLIDAHDTLRRVVDALDGLRRMPTFEVPQPEEVGA